MSLFAHKKNDIVSVQFLDADGGVHGSIFQLNKGQGEVFRNELVSHGAQVSDPEREHEKKGVAEVVTIRLH